MARYVVTTALDVSDAGDGLLSLREAVALANTGPDADRIVFDADLTSVALTEGELEIAGGSRLIIDGDHDGDGLSDLWIDAADHHHVTNERGADLTLTGLTFFGGRIATDRPAAEPGESRGRAQDGERGFGVSDVSFLTPEGRAIRRQSAGDDGEDGGAGATGAAGGAGGDGEAGAGSIVNYGDLTLVRVSFGSNRADGRAGADGGRGGDGGFAGGGGHGFDGSRSFMQGNVDPVRDYPDHSGVTEGGAGGRGGDGGNGGTGGAGGDGGAAAGAILNDSTGSIVMTDVSFGGAAVGGFVLGGNSGRGGAAGRGGAGGSGQTGGSGGDGANGGRWEEEAAVSGDGVSVFHVVGGDGGAGGDAGDAGVGGNGGAHGVTGLAAGAIVNFGRLSGAMALSDNDAETASARPAQANGGFAGFGPTGADGGRGSETVRLGIAYDPDLDREIAVVTSRTQHEDGEAGAKGADAQRGAGSAAGTQGATAPNVLTAEGGQDAADSAGALVYAHGVDVAGGEAAGERVLGFNVIRLGDPAARLAVDWRIEGRGVNAADAADFEGGGMPSGTLVLAARDPDDAAGWRGHAKVEVRVAADALDEGEEGFRFVLTAVRAQGASSARLGTATVDGTIVDGDGGDGGGKTVDDLIGDRRGDKLTGGGADDLIKGLGGNDLLKGKGGADDIRGGGGDDKLLGGGGADRLRGDGGEDDLRGGGGRDLLDGGKGRDKLDGGAGRDVLHFDRGDGKDVVRGFRDGQDRIEIGAGARRMKDLDIEQKGKHVLIDHGRVGDQIKVLNADADDFSARDFLF